MAINKVVYGNDTLIDLTSDTVTADKVLDGYTFHDASGTKRTGTGGSGITFPLDISDNTNNVTGVLNPVNGGTGNDSGYVRAGQKANTTIGTRATAEGYNNTASGNYSHAEGYETIAKGDYSHAQGKYNIQDDNNTYALIVGNGTADNDRSNALTVDWEGNAWFAGDVEDGNGNTISKNSEDLRFYENAGYLGRNLWRGDRKISGSGTIAAARATSNTNKIIISGKLTSPTSQGQITVTLYFWNSSTQSGDVRGQTYAWYGQKTDFDFNIPFTASEGYCLTNANVSSNTLVIIKDFQIEDGDTVHPYTPYVPAIPKIVSSSKDKYLHTNALTGDLEWTEVQGGGSSATILTGTLTAGQTTITFTDSAITATALVDIYTDDPDVGWVSRSASGTTLTVTYPVQSTDLSVTIRIEETGV